MPMPVGGRLGRASRFLLEYDYRDGLDRNGLPVFRSGHIPSFARGGTVNAAMALDRNGRYSAVGPSTPMFHHQYNAATGLLEPAGLMLQALGMNSAPGSCSYADSTYWSLAASYTITPVTSCIAGQIAYKNLYAAGFVNRRENIGVFVNGQPECFSQIFEYAGDATATIGIYDTTAGASLVVATLAWATKTAAITTGSGACGVIDLGTGPNGVPMVRVWVIGTGTGAGTGAAGNVCTLLLAPSGSATVGLGAILHHSQFERATSYPSSPIVTGAGAVTRAPTLFSVACLFGLRAVTCYLDATDLMGVSLNQRAFLIGNAAGATPYLQSYRATAGWRADLQASAGASTSTAAAAVAYGSRIELRPFLTVNGASVTASIGASIDGGAEIIGAAGTSRALDPSYSIPTRLYIGTDNSGASGANLSIRRLRVAAGANRSMDYMRAGD